MRKITLILAVLTLLSALLAGCRSNVPQETNGVITSDPTTAPGTMSTTASTQPSTAAPTTGNQEGSTAILETIWAQFGDNEKFSTYGGSIENPVTDAPGALLMSATDELTGSYLLPADQLGSITEGASLVHMMNGNIFTAVVVKVNEGAMESLFGTWRDNIQNNRWICGQPDRLVMVNVDGSHLLMSFGSSDAMNLFKEKLSATYPDSTTLYDEAIVS